MSNPTDNPKPDPGVLGGMPGFFYDVICRMVPGGILLYVLGCISWEDQSFVKSAAFLAVAWLIGFTIDIFGFTVVRLVLSELPQKEWKERLEKHVIESQIHISEIASHYRQHAIRKHAECVLFRNMIVVCGFIIVAPLLTNVPGFPTEWLARFKVGPWWWGAIGGVVSYVCWRGAHYSLVNDKLMMKQPPAPVFKAEPKALIVVLVLVIIWLIVKGVNSN